MAKRIKVVEMGAAVAVEQDAKPLRTSGAKLCAFCKHKYLRPCSEATYKACSNWQHLKRGK